MTELAGARIRKARWNPGGRTFELLLRVGGTGGEGDADLLLRYRGVGLLEPALPVLAALVEDTSLAVERAELGGAVGAWRHQVNLGPRGVILVECGAIDEHETPAAAREPLEPGVRFEVVSC